MANCHLSLKACITINGELSLQTYTNNDELVVFDRDDITNDYFLIYIDILFAYRDDKTHINNLTEIFETKNYKYLSLHCHKLFFVNTYVVCHDIYYYSYQCLFNFETLTHITTQNITYRIPFIIYSKYPKKLENYKVLNDQFTITNIMHTDKYKDPCRYNFYIVMGKGQFTKKAVSKHK